MIIYFADRMLNILGMASTNLPDGLSVKDDLKTEDIDTGVASFECYIPYDLKTREDAEAWAAVGNYILRSNGKEREFYTIIESESDTGRQEVYIYAEDAGLDLLNEVCGAYTADKAYNIAHYINKFSYDSGFEIGVNEVPGLTRKLSWDGEATATERIASVATQFDGCEISYSFAISGLAVTHKYINIYKRRGKDLGVQLRLNYDIDSIVTKKSIANLATALECTGGTPEDSETPITLSGYTYDDGNFYVSGSRLCSREAVKKWSRYVWNREPGQIASEKGHIVKTYSYDTLDRATLCAHAITELKKISDIEVNFEVDIKMFPDNTHIGDRVNIIDDAGRLYMSARILRLESSAANDSHTATIGEYLIKDDGISQKVLELAEQLKKDSVSAKRAKLIADQAKAKADDAQAAADQAQADAASAGTVADAAMAEAGKAVRSADNAVSAANTAQSAVDAVKTDVEGLQTTVAEAQAAADQAQEAAETAQLAITETQAALQDAQESANEAKTAADAAQATANTAITKSDAAANTADTAKTQAEAAATTAAAAKLDAEKAREDIASLGDSLTTLENTMSADYARKTDLTETQANLQTQITQNAAGISANAKSIVKVDERANNAAETAAAAQSTAAQAQTEAATAKTAADNAQKAADDATAAASTAQSYADQAQTEAAAAKALADKADADLTAAKADLATVQGRVDATEEDIEAAKAAVTAAASAAEKAKTDATEAAEKAAAAQTTADTAAANAEAAHTKANAAAASASAAQAAAEAAQGDASAAQATADEAKQAAQSAQTTADTAKTNAQKAQDTANSASESALAALAAADDAAEEAARAQLDLAAAQKNLADVTSRVDATEEDIRAAQDAVENAQKAVDTAVANAAAAQTTADAATAYAQAAQTAADNAKNAADEAQAAADEAQAAADQAQEDVNALEVRVTEAETSIQQNADQIKLMATKQEVSNTLGGYYTKEQTDAAITIESDNIMQTVSRTMAGKDEIVSIINQTPEAIKISASKVDLTGYVTLTNLSTPGQTVINGANIQTGTILADKLDVNDLSAISALIGGWELGTGYIRDLDANGHYTGIGRYGIAEAFFAGGTLEDGSDGVFRVGHDGSLYATDATISGNINAESLYVSEPVYTEVATIAGTNDVMANYMQTITTNNPFGNDVAKGYSYFGMLVESEGLAGSGSVSDAGITIRTSEKRHDYGYLMADMTIYASGTLGLESDTEITINGKSFLDAIYPVGSIYMSVKSTNPGTLFGGTWVAWGSGRVPVGVNGSDTNFATVEKTGGASTVKLTAAQSGVPAHAHGLNGHTHAMATNPQGVMKYNNPGGQMTRTQVATSSSSKKYAFTASGTDYLIYGSGAATGGASGSAANNAAAPAASAHDNLQPYITCYMFKRTA